MNTIPSGAPLPPSPSGTESGSGPTQKEQRDEEKSRRLIRDVRARELVADIVGSAAWEAFVFGIVEPFVKARQEDALVQIRRGALDKSQACLAAADAAYEIIFGAYEGTGQEIPKEVRAIRRLG